MSNSEIKRNQSVERVLDILEVMAIHGEAIRLNDLSDKLEMSPTTVYRFLKTLMDKGYVKQDEESSKYFLTLKLNYYAEQIHHNYSLRNIVSPFLKLISEETGESASLVVKEDNMAVYIDKYIGSNKMIQSLQKIGNRAPLYCTGVGKVFLAAMEQNELEKVLKETSPFEKLTVNTLTEYEMIAEELSIIKEKGVSYDNEECEIGAKCVAVPIRDYTGSVIAAISVSGPVSRMEGDNIKQIERLLIEKGESISRILGYM